MKYIFFGAGRNGKRNVRTLTELLGEDRLYCFVDNLKAGTVICGKHVIDFDELKRIYKNYIVLVTIKKSQLLFEVESQLNSAGIPFDRFDSMYCLQLLKEKVNRDNNYYQKYKKELDYMISMNRIEMVPYAFRDYYLNKLVSVTYMSDKDLFCCDYIGKKLYFPRFQDLTMREEIEMLQVTVQNLLTEQDESSPHRYFTLKHRVACGDIFVDIGAAEAMTSLEVIDKASKVYIFEGDERWIVALQETFTPYADKVVIVNKFVGEHNDARTVKLDTFFEKIEGNLFIKVDIEGNERGFLGGAEKLLQRKGTKISLCVYHYPQDAEEFMVQFRKWGYKCELSSGWLFVWGDFARGVMYGQLS